MIKLKVSYEEEKEILLFINKIKNEIKSIKKSNNTNGKYKKVYIELKEL